VRKEINMMTIVPSARRLAFVTALLTAGLALTGCVFDDIHSEMQSANANLEPLDERIARGNDVLVRLEAELQQVSRANDLLETGNERLESLEQRLAVMESVQQSLVSIDTTLKHLDAHLASLRKTIDNIDSTIPFLKFSDDTDTESTAEPTVAGPQATDPPPPPTPEPEPEAPENPK
jgi:prefoldin subunit 5